MFLNMDEMNKLIVGMFCLGLFGCAAPAQKFDAEAIALGFDAHIVNTAQFQHKIYSSRNLSKAGTLHVYLDGDGTPWERNRWIADDPTARNPLILQLMAQDKMPSVLLGRPCYYDLKPRAECNNKYWTSHRYSREVVNSMAYALNRWIDRYAFNEVVLIGYSGGGTIAMLMADKINKIVKVVTVAANLNVKSWSEFHGYLPLKYSLNPAENSALKNEFKQIHIAGEDDDIVPAFIVKAYADSQKNAKYYEYPNKDHACCWEEEWSNILDIINSN